MKSFNGKTAAEMRLEIMAIRQPGEGRVGRNITFGAYARDVLKADPAKVLHDLGVNLSAMTVQALVTSDPAVTWLYPEAIREAIMEGFLGEDNAWWRSLVAADIPVPSKTIDQPRFVIDRAQGPHETEEGESFRITQITSGDRHVTIRKNAEQMQLTYEAVQFATLAMVQVWTQQYGSNMASTMNAYVVDRLVNGDQADGSYAPATIGVNSVADGFTWKDFLRVCTRMAKLGNPISSVIADEDEITDLMLIEQFQRLQQGAPLTALTMKTPVPSQLDAFCHSGVGADKFCFVCASKAAYKATAIPLLVETDSEITRQVKITACSETSDAVNLLRTARVIVDRTVTYAANSFPAWMSAGD